MGWKRSKSANIIFLLLLCVQKVWFVVKLFLQRTIWINHFHSIEREKKEIGEIGEWIRWRTDMKKENWYSLQLIEISYSRDNTEEITNWCIECATLTIIILFMDTYSSYRNNSHKSITLTFSLLLQYNFVFYQIFLEASQINDRDERRMTDPRYGFRVEEPAKDQRSIGLILFYRKTVWKGRLFTEKGVISREQRKESEMRGYSHHICFSA